MVTFEGFVKGIASGTRSERSQDAEDPGSTPAAGIPERFLRPPLLQKALDQIVIGRGLPLPEECLAAFGIQVVLISSAQALVLLFDRGGQLLDRFVEAVHPRQFPARAEEGVGHPGSIGVT